MIFSLSQFESITPKEAIQFQKKLRERIRLEPLKKEPALIAGADVSLEWNGDTAFAGIVVLSFPELKVVESAFARRPITFPYIPGLLSFREIPALLEAWGKIKNKPDVTIVDGHGIAHPRRTGIATHLGLATQSPTIGCAKKKLVGSFAEPGTEAGSMSEIYDKKTEETLGYALRTKTNIKPVFVSPGNNITLQESVDIVLRSTKGYKLPEPTRLAHNLTNAFRRGEI